jgi:hypothetical protein
LAEADSGQFAGGVAIGSSYAGVNTPPTNGLIVQGPVGIGTTTVTSGSTIDMGSASGQVVTRILGGSSGTGAGPCLQFASGGNIGALGSVSGCITGGTYNSDFAFYEGATTNNVFHFYAGGSEMMNISTVGMSINNGSTSASNALDVHGKVYVGTFASASSTTVCQNANVLSTCSSARRYKEKIQPYPNGLKEVLAMRPVTFDFKNHADNWERHDFGFVAEDMEKINPLFVTYNDKGDIEGVRYMQLSAVYVKALQELNEIITNQQSEIAALKRAVMELQHDKQSVPDHRDK